MSFEGHFPHRNRVSVVLISRLMRNLTLELNVGFQWFPEPNKCYSIFELNVLFLCTGLLLQKFVLYLWPAEISEDEAEDRLQDAIQEKFSVFGDV